MNTRDVVLAIQDERIRQNKIWGEQNHTPDHWLAILMEEVGEAAKAATEEDENSYIEELIQVAAVAVSMIESFYRQKYYKERTK